VTEEQILETGLVMLALTLSHAQKAQTVLVVMEVLSQHCLCSRYQTCDHFHHPGASRRSFDQQRLVVLCTAFLMELELDSVCHLLGEEVSPLW
jgi:hypothetical protein